jgi:BirA family transcriptional regulator, biotin operon repressor / biotin---[acetyl-CoA-carboxylase] ligase
MKIWLRSTDSTMRDAAKLAARGEVHGTVVVAESQTEGMGRHGHTWHSEHGGGIYASIILRLSLTPDALPILPMGLGLGVQRAVNDHCGINCDLRWPNDLLLNEKKLAGTMVQSADPGTHIAGIGLNVNQTSFPEELQSIATSLRIETGLDHAREELLDRLVCETLASAALLVDRGKRQILDEFEARSSYVRGKTVTVNGDNRRFTGITVGLDDNGFLMVETPEGIETVLSGGVRASA